MDWHDFFQSQVSYQCPNRPRGSNRMGLNQRQHLLEWLFQHQYTVHCASTWADNGNVTVRSVGYSHSGSDLGNTKGNSCLLLQKHTDIRCLSERISGELFLGTYSFDGNESRTDGITFGSRPASLSFDYTYAPYGDEKGLAYVAVFDESGRIIATGSMNLNSVGPRDH